MTAIEDVLWPGIRDICGSDVINAGIHVRKPGYHGDRNWLRKNHPGDYSIQTAADQQGPGNEGSGIDVTFKSAQRGDYSNIAVYSKRLYVAGQEKDPRAYPLREFYGNTDRDRQVEGWSYYRDRAQSSDPSHAWHDHLSVLRKYINDEKAMRSILAIWSGAPIAPPKPDFEPFPLEDFKGAVKVSGWNRGWPSHVLVCQHALKEVGLNPGPLDGLRGERTVGAMNQFLEQWDWETASGRIIHIRQLDRLIWEAEKKQPGFQYPPRSDE